MGDTAGAMDLLPTTRHQKKEQALKEADVLAMLRARFTKAGNGGNGQYAFLEKVRNGAGFNANRTLDAVVVDLWPSRGLTIDGFEVKVSRSDWLRELGQPDKAEDACKLVDRFWVAAPRGVVLNGELPPTWGLMEVTGKKLVQVVAAPLLRPPVPHRLATVSRDFLVGILRSCPTAVPNLTAAAELAAAERKGHAEGFRVAEERRREAERRADAAELTLRQFGEIMGVSLQPGWNYRDEIPAERIAKIAAALRAVVDGDDRVTQAEQRVAAVVRQLREEADRIEKGLRW